MTHKHSQFDALLSRRLLLKALAGSLVWLGGASCAPAPGATNAPPTRSSLSRPSTQRMGQVLTTFRGHTDRVTTVTWSPDGLSLASGSLDRTIRIWRVPAHGENSSNLPQAIFRGHTAGVTAVAWSPDGQSLASASLDQTVRVWKTQDISEPLIFRGHTDAVQTLCWSPDSQHIASGSSDQTVRVWLASNAQPLYTYHGHHAAVTTVAWSPDGQRLASGSSDQTVQVWSASTAQPIYTYRTHTKPVTSIAWSPDSQSLASGSLDKTARIWDSTSGQTLYTYNGFNVAATHLDPTKGLLPEVVLGVAWAHHSQRLAILSQQYCGDTCGAVLVYDAQTQRYLSFYLDLPIFQLAWSPDDTRFASALTDQTVQISEARSL